jgi:hypothetical protein
MGVTIRNVPLPINALPETVAVPETQPTDIGAHAASASSGDTPDLDLPPPIQVGDVPNTTFIAYANITTVAPPLSASDTPVPPDVPVRTLDSSLEASAASTVAAPVVEEALPITFFEATPPSELTDTPTLAPFQPESSNPSPPNNASPTTGYYTEVHATGEGGELPSPPPPSPPSPPPPLSTPKLRLTNGLPGEINMIVGAGVETNFNEDPNTKYNPLQTNFLKAVSANEANVHYVSVAGTIPENTGFNSENSTTLPVTSNVMDWVQDPMLSLTDINTGNIILLEPRRSVGYGSHVAEQLDGATSLVTEVRQSDIYFEGGDIRAVGTDRLIVGAQSLRGDAGVPETSDGALTLPQQKALVNSTSAYMTEFSKYGVDPNKMTFLGSNEEGITYRQVLAQMTPEEIAQLHSSINRLQDQQLPLMPSVYHSDFSVLPTGMVNAEGKPVLLMSEDNIPLPPANEMPLQYTIPSGQEESYSNLLLRAEKTKQRQALDRAKLEADGFAIETLPSSVEYPNWDINNQTNPGETTIQVINYTNVVQDSSTVYVPVRGGDDPFDAQALATFQRVYGSTKKIVPVEGTISTWNAEGLLNCDFLLLNKL